MQVKGQLIGDVFPIFNEQTMLPVENPVAKVMELGRIVGLANHTVLRNTNGTYTPIEDSASPIRDHQDKLIGVVLVFRDATLERKTQAALRESEKLTSAARMSDTVAHEINNPLEAVGNLLYLAKRTPGVPEVAIEHLVVAEQELSEFPILRSRHSDSTEKRKLQSELTSLKSWNTYSNCIRTNSRLNQSKYSVTSKTALPLRDCPES